MHKLAFAPLVIACAAVAATAHAEQAHMGYSVLYQFCQLANCADGNGPASDLIADSSGNIYGATSLGGANNQGVVFKVTSAGTETVLHSFCNQTGCADGANPGYVLIFDKAGNLYGSTLNGGNANCSQGCGTVFKLAPDGKYKVLYAFCPVAGCADGQTPVGPILKKGNLYGITQYGGSSAWGTVWEIPAKGTETVLHSFAGGSDGALPQTKLLMDASGNLFGTTVGGGGKGPCTVPAPACGTVFEISSTGVETVLYSFCSQNNCIDGVQPIGPLVKDRFGNLFGTTLNLGLNNAGTAFRIAAGGGETTLYNFCGLANCPDGANPTTGLLESGTSGTAFFGTTRNGGANNAGTAFKIVNGTETVLHSFTSGQYTPAYERGLLRLNGWLYGTIGGNPNFIFKLGTKGG